MRKRLIRWLMGDAKWARVKSDGDLELGRASLVAWETAEHAERV